MGDKTKRLLLEMAGCRAYDPDALKRKYLRERDGRIRPEGGAQYVSTKGLFKNFGGDPWVAADLKRDPLIEHTEAIVAGGGFGGLLTGARAVTRGAV